jgi:uncharacterized delta-60 repeat protein
MSQSNGRRFGHVPKNRVAPWRLVEHLERRTLLSVAIPATADARVERLAGNAASQQANFGRDPQLAVDAAAAAGAESFVTFDLGQAGAVGSALIRLHGGRADGGDAPILVGAFAVPDPGWVEGDGTGASPDADGSPAGEITWNARPATAGAALDAAHVSRAGDYYLNVTAYVRDRKAAGAAAVSFALRNVDAVGGRVVFDAREAGATGPALVVEPNDAGPDAAFTAPNLTAATPTQQITATYTDADAIAVGSIDVNDLVVTAPGRPAAQVTAVAVTATTPTSATAVYTVAGPGGDWGADDDALYTAFLQSGQVTDVAGNPAAGGPDAFFVTIGAGSPGSTDAAAPTAVATAPAVTQAGGTTGTVTVAYADDNAINAATIDVGDVVVARPGSPALRVTGVTVSPAGNGRQLAATYTFNALGGTWNDTDNGTYEVRVVAGAVADVAGKLTPAATGTFAVAVPAAAPPAAGDVVPPAAVVANPPPVEAAGVATREVRVTYTDDVAVDVGSVDVGDVTVSLNGVVLPVVAVSASPPVDGRAVTAIYTVAAPAGGFSAQNNGAYAVAVATGAVVDTSRNALAAAATGAFEVALPPPEPTVDPTFAAGAVVAADAEGSVVQPDGRILVAGHTGDLAAGTSAGVLQRFNPDGTPDGTFGKGGQVVTADGTDAYYAVRVAPDGTIVVAGTAGGNFAVTRFKANGAPDRSFGTGGRAEADFGGADVAYAVAVGADGSVVAGGASATTSGGGTSFALARFLADGSPDVFFGDNGRSLLLNSPGDQAIGGVAVQTDGKIVAAGSSGGRVTVVRVGPDGLQDATYGVNGAAVVDGLDARADLGGPDYTVGLALQPDDKAVVANTTAGGDFGVARLTADGRPDAAFGTGGVATVDFGGDDDADAVFAQGTGEILVVGTTHAGGDAGSAAGSSTAVVALGQDGTPDASYGSGGKVVVDTTPSGSGRALHIGDIIRRAFAGVGPDGRLVVGSGLATPAGAAPQSGLRRLNIPGSGLVGLFGAVTGKARPLKFADADGTSATFTLKGGGTARAYFDGTYVDLVVSGSTPQSVLTLKAKGGDGRLRLRDVQADGPMKGFRAPAADLSGTLSVGGDLGDLRLGTVTGTAATAGSAKSVQLSGDLNGGRILVGAGLGSDGKLGGAASRADTFAGASLASLVVRGRANAALVTAGVDPRNGTFLDSDDQLVGGRASTIGSVQIRGGADPSTRFVAGGFDRVRLPGPSSPGEDARLQSLL